MFVITILQTDDFSQSCYSRVKVETRQRNELRVFEYNGQTERTKFFFEIAVDGTVTLVNVGIVIQGGQGIGMSKGWVSVVYTKSCN